MPARADRPDVLSRELLELFVAHVPVGQVVHTISQRQPNRVAEVSPEGVRIETTKSRSEGTGAQLVPAWMLQVAWERLMARQQLTNRELVADDDLSIKRSSAVVALLAALPGVSVTGTRPIELAYAPPAAEAPGVAAELTTDDIEASIARFRELGPDEFLRWAGEQIGAYTIAEGIDEFDAVAILRGARCLRGFPVADTYADDAPSVAEPLRGLGFFVESGTDRDAPMSAGEERLKRWLDQLPATTDGWTQTTFRREQSVLRQALQISSRGGPADCGLCGRGLPGDLLVAAHIKPRYACDHVERLDIPWIAMPACSLGCDALYERGYLAVAADGRFVTSARGVDLGFWEGRRAVAYDPQRTDYFAWHRSHVFKG